MLVEEFDQLGEVGMIAINAAAAEFEKLRAMGYRTPHK